MHLDITSDTPRLPGLHPVELAPGIRALELRTDRFVALVSLLGGQLLQFTPHGEAPLFYLSPDALYQTGKSIRGGIPVCWPWFGAHPDPDSHPAHGVARQCEWSLAGAAREDDDFVIRLSGPRHQGLTVEMHMTLGSRITLSLRTHNGAVHPQTVGTALHTYFAVADVQRASVTGLAGLPFEDKVTGQEGRFPAGAFAFTGETDRIVYGEGPFVLQDPAGGRHITLQQQGAGSCVVWNPWIEKTTRLVDMPDADWQRFVCLETANAGKDVRVLAPGETHELRAQIRWETC